MRSVLSALAPEVSYLKHPQIPHTRGASLPRVCGIWGCFPPPPRLLLTNFACKERGLGAEGSGGGGEGGAEDNGPFPEGFPPLNHLVEVFQVEKFGT